MDEFSVEKWWNGIYCMGKREKLRATPSQILFHPHETHLKNFGVIRRAQFPTSTLLASTLCLWDLFRTFKVCSDEKERVWCGKQREATATIQSLLKLQPWFLSLRWKACLRQNCSLDSCACSEGPALGQNTLMMMSTLVYFVLSVFLESLFNLAFFKFRLQGISHRLDHGFISRYT